MSEDVRRYAILEHRWDGVHWDFLVEDGPTLRTWAVDEPIAEGVEQAARPLKPHRRIYLDYEGEVSGGRGTVRRWDAGTCRILAWGEDRVVLELRGGQLVGEVEFRSDRSFEPPAWFFRFGNRS